MRFIDLVPLCMFLADNIVLVAQILGSSWNSMLDTLRDAL